MSTVVYCRRTDVEGLERLELTTGPDSYEHLFERVEPET